MNKWIIAGIVAVVIVIIVILFWNKKKTETEQEELKQTAQQNDTLSGIFGEDTSGMVSTSGEGRRKLCATKCNFIINKTKRNNCFADCRTKFIG